MADKTATRQPSTGPAPFLFTTLAVVLLVAFFSYRGADVGQIGKLIGSLGGGPLVGSGIVDSFLGALAAGLIGVSWFGLGNLVLSKIRVSRSDDHSHILELAMKTAVGSAIWSLIWFFLGLAGGYSGLAAVIATVAGLALTAIGLRRVREAKNESRVPEKATGFDWILLLLIAVPLALAFIAALAPPTAKDTLLYHFAVPKAFIGQGGSGFIDGNIASYLALGTEMHSVWAMLLGNFVSARAGEAAAGATVFLFFPLLLAAVFGWSREIGISRQWSLTAVLIVATIPTAYHVASSGYIDIALALFVTLAVYALCRWWRTEESGPLVLMAVCLGAALSIKLTALFVFAAVALIILLRARAATGGTDKVGRIVMGGFAALVLAGAIASPWYLRTWKATGSPVFPFYMSIWPGTATGWDAERSNLFQAMNTQYGGADKGALEYFATPWNLSIAAQPEDAAHFDGVLGVAFLFGLPVLVWGLWKFDLPVEARIGAGVAGIMFLFWLFSSQQLRYLLPIVPVLAIATMTAAGKISAGSKSLAQVWQYGFAVMSFAALLVAAAWFCQKAPLRVALGGESRDQYLIRNLDYYPYYETVNRDVPAGDRVWLINMRRDTYNIERPIFSDYLFEDWTLRKMVWEARTVQDVRAKATAMGIRYVLARHDFLFDFDHSTLVDDKKPRGENEAKLRIAKEFLLDPAHTVSADSKFSLVRVF